MAQSRASGTRRVWLPAAAFMAFALLVLFRLIQVQVLDHDEYAATARDELQVNEAVFSRRGAILDRNGNVLATSIDTWDIYVSARIWSDAQRAAKSSEALAKALGIDPVKLRADVAKKETGDILIARDVDYEVGRELLELRLSGVVALPNTVRVNPNGDLGAGVVGMTGGDNTGLSGLEHSLDAELQGKPGKAVYERDTTGAPIPFGQFVVSTPEPGKDAVTTIDRFLQRMVEDRLAAAIEATQSKGGEIIIMDPNTGEILAQASAPRLKYSQFPPATDAQVALLKNRAATETYQPGSVMKVITTAAAIDSGVVSPNTGYTDVGYVKQDDVELKNWKGEAWGDQTMTGVLQNSINTGAVFMARLVGKDRFAEYQRAFGFGRTTGAGLPGEAAGFYNEPDDKNWTIADFWTQAFGQGINVTALQMVTAFSAVINGGELLKPHIVKAYITDSGQRLEVPRVVVGRPISAATSATLRKMLFDVVDPPDFGHPAKPRDYLAGGKSGTADIEAKDGRPGGGIIVSFAGFAPYANPRIVVYVKLEEPKSEEATGTRTAAPIFKLIVDDTLHYLNVPPDTGVLVEAR